MKTSPPLHLPLRLDCRHYRGDRPCAVGIQGVCPPACHQYSAQGHRILILKLGALGDVIRTTALLPSLKRQWPQSHVTWITRPAGVRMLRGHPLIDRLLPFDTETVCHVEYEHFDLCLSLDKEPGPTALAMRVRASEKLGMGLSAVGSTYPLNAEAADYFRLGLDDELKFRHNTLSYAALIHAAVGLPYHGDRYRLYPTAVQQMRATKLWSGWGVQPTDTVIGLNTGAGQVFANKTWSPDQFAALARHLVVRPGWKVALLGGPEERVQNRVLAERCIGVIDTGTDHGELEFAAVVQRCQAIVTGDTMAMHVAIALAVPCIALFGPTCAQEIDFFGRGEAIMTSASCAPCYRRTCDISPHCMDRIELERVLNAVERWTSPGTASSSSSPATPTCVLPVLA